MKVSNLRNLFLLASAYSLIFLGGLLLAWYAISGATFRAIFYIAEGFTSHFAAQALAQSGLSSQAISLQRNSIRAYQLSDANLPCEPLKALVCDELRHLANIYLKCKNRTESLATVKRMEAIMRLQLSNETPNNDRWKGSLAELLLFQARIFNNDNHKEEAITRYRESIAINQTLINECHTNTGTKSQLSSAQRELEELLKK